MKTAQSPKQEATASDSSAPAADRPATAANPETPEPTVVEDEEANAMLTEDELGNLPLPPEVTSARLAELETWDAAVTDSGYRVAPQAAEDESEFPEILVEEGVDEAEEELRAVEEEKEQLIEREAEEEEL
jgi:hypothetical protein